MLGPRLPEMLLLLLFAATVGFVLSRIIGFVSRLAQRK